MAIVNPIILDEGTSSDLPIRFRMHPLTGIFLSSEQIAFNVGGTNIFNVGSAGTSATGTTTNNNAAAGQIGEVMSSVIPVVSAVSLTSAAAASITTLTLTAGDWDLSGIIVYHPGATTSVTISAAAISQTDNAVPAIIGQPTAGEVLIQNSSAAQIPVNDFTVSIPRCRVSLAASTPVYIVAKATFSVSTLSAYGSIYARRAR
jgi:hypothetical protein